MVEAYNKINTSDMINVDEVQSGVFSWIKGNKSQQGQKNCFTICTYLFIPTCLASKNC